MREDGGGMCEREPLEENGLSSCALGGTVCLWYCWWHLPEVQGLGMCADHEPTSPRHWRAASLPLAASCCFVPMMSTYSLEFVLIWEDGGNEIYFNSQIR